MMAACLCDHRFPIGFALLQCSALVSLCTVSSVSSVSSDTVMQKIVSRKKKKGWMEVEVKFIEELKWGEVDEEIKEKRMLERVYT